MGREAFWMAGMVQETNSSAIPWSIPTGIIAQHKGTVRKEPGMAKKAVYKLRANRLEKYKLDGVPYEEMTFYRLGNNAEDAKHRLAFELHIQKESIEILESGKPQ